MAITQEELGKRIAEARSRRHISQGELAEDVGLSQSAVSRIESGERSVDSLELAAIARALGVSVLDLLEDRPVPEAFRALAARAEEARAPGALEAARDRLIELVRLERLLDELGVAAGERPAPPALPVAEGSSREQGRQLAEALREDLELPPGPLLELVDLVEDLGLDIALEPLAEGLAGLCVRTDDLALALVDSSPVVGRQRFTIAHELCHYLVDLDHDGQPFWVDEQLFGEVVSRRSQETRANSFAAHFLMPQAGIERTLGDQPVTEDMVVELQYAFRVSLEALVWHLSNMKRITPRLRKLLQQLGPRALSMRHGYIAEWSAQERERGIVRPPGRLLRRALDAYEAGSIGVERLAYLLRHSDPDGLRQELEDVGLTPDGGWIKDTAPA